MAVVFRTHSDIEASIVRGLLEAHGIYAGGVVRPDARRLPAEHRRPRRGAHRGAGVADADAAPAIIREQRARPPAAEVVPFADDTRDLSALEDRLGYRFREPAVLERALTHRSRPTRTPPGSTIDNESLEFLGDAVLGFVMADLLFRDFPQFDEGQKSKIKASLVSTATLARLARRLGLGEFLVLGRGEEKTGGRREAGAARRRLRGGHRRDLPRRRHRRGAGVRRARVRARTSRTCGARSSGRATTSRRCRSWCRRASSRCPSTRSPPRAAPTTARSSTSKCACAAR